MEIAYGDEGIRLIVEDAGHGFDAGVLGSKAGLGFVSMRERLRLVHGTLQVQSTAQGTTLDIRVPAAVAVAGAMSADIDASQAARA